MKAALAVNLKNTNKTYNNDSTVTLWYVFYDNNILL